MDPYQAVDHQPEAVRDAIIARLESRGEHPLFRGFIEEYLSAIRWDAVHQAVDLGCGTGVVTRLLARQAGSATRVLGVDLSEKLLEAARGLARTERIEWCCASADALPMEDNSADLAILHTLMSHVPEPGAVLREVYRVLRPGGRAVIFDADYASATFGLADFERGRQLDLKLFSAIVDHLDVCRQLPGLIAGAGLKLTDFRPHVIAEAGHGDFWLSSVRGFEKLIPALGILPEEEGRAWTQELLARHEAGAFFASGNYYTFTAEKPGNAG
jgi:SAM-dependent methyltransferase